MFTPSGRMAILPKLLVKQNRLAYKCVETWKDDDTSVPRSSHADNDGFNCAMAASSAKEFFSRSSVA